MSEIQLFEIDSRDWRFGRDDDGALWVVASDIARSLDHSNTSVMLRSLDEDEKGLRTVYTPGGQQKLAVVFEDGIWELIFLSRKPEARAIKKRVKAVLREIREKGGYLSPTATADQLTMIANRAEVQTRVLRNLSGIVDAIWLEGKARHVAARALGEEPEINLDDRPLTVGEYLEERGIKGVALRKLSPKFGQRLRRVYFRTYGHNPGTVPRFVDGALRNVKAYTERHRPLFDATWREITGEDA